MQPQCLCVLYKAAAECIMRGRNEPRKARVSKPPPPGGANYSQEKEDTAHNNSGKGKLLLPPPYLKSTPQNNNNKKKTGSFSLCQWAGGQTRSSGDSDDGDGSFCILF